ncbi:MAG: alpha/beta fold hydrolase [Woeseiaceae bacterium]|nr:alpha/beta fold hydrolase [Woeseiaceae bacterium]
MNDANDSPATASDFEITAADGFNLAATLFAADRNDTVVVVNAATAVPRGFYRRFAGFVRAHGWSAVTYDYRGIGGSAPKSLRGFAASARDWALLDMTAVIGWIGSELSPRRLFAIGHSYGGQTLGMIDNATSVDAMVGVSAQSGYWGAQGGNESQKVRFFVTVAIPMLSHLFGYFPWSWLGSGADLPKGVALEWAKWCRQPNYLLDDVSLPLDNYRRFTSPVLAYSIDDDPWGSAGAVDDMMRAYPQTSRRHLVPADYGIEQLGHMGYFRAGSEPLWREAIQWLDETTPAGNA